MTCLDRIIVQVPESSTTEDTKNTEKPVSSGDSNEPSSDNAP